MEGGDARDKFYKSNFIDWKHCTFKRAVVIIGIGNSQNFLIFGEDAFVTRSILFVLDCDRDSYQRKHQ